MTMSSLRELALSTLRPIRFPDRASKAWCTTSFPLPCGEGPAKDLHTTPLATVMALKKGKSIPAEEAV